MRITLVVNPVGSAVTPERREKVETALRSGHDLDVVETGKRGDATPAARAAAEAGADAVVVLGGDGTQNEAANGLIDTSTALAALPGGSTNVFARTIGFAKKFDPATDQLLAALANGSRRRIGVGQVNGRAFLFHVGAGFDAAVVKHVEKRGHLKRTIGQAVFVVATFATLRSYDRSRPRFAVRFPHGEEVDGYFAIFMASNPYTYLGRRPFNVAPDADFQRGLAGLVFRDLKPGTIARAARSALGSGRRLSQDPKLVRRTELGSLEVVGHGPFPYQVDGDYLGDVDGLELSHRPSALDVVAP